MLARFWESVVDEFLAHHLITYWLVLYGGALALLALFALCLWISRAI